MGEGFRAMAGNMEQMLLNRKLSWRFNFFFKVSFLNIDYILDVLKENSSQDLAALEKNHTKSTPISAELSGVI